MTTTSETAFESFLTENGLPFQRVPEHQTHGRSINLIEASTDASAHLSHEEQNRRRPDYLVQIGDAKVYFEVKEIEEDENFTKGVYSRTIGKHIRSKIVEARRQVQYGAKQQGIPSVLLIYNNLDPLFLFGTEDHDFKTAMYGEYTLKIGRESRKVVDHYHGKNDFLQEERNTSFSALGHLYPVRGRLKVTLFENAFAKVKIPFDALPSCFDVKRVEITYSEHV